MLKTNVDYILGILPHGQPMAIKDISSSLGIKEETIEKIRELIGKELLDAHSNLAIVVVKSPREITKTPGVLAHFANILALENINIVEMMSTHAETAFIVEERDALKTIEILRREIKRSRTPV